MIDLNIYEELKKGQEKGFYKNLALCVGDSEEEFFKCFVEADEETLFDMASITKIMVTTMIAYKMLEEGRLCLFDPISIYLEVPKDKEMITIQHLMTHTAGFEPFFDLEKEAKKPDKVIETIMSRPLYGEVGKQVYYSCIGYIVLGKILEKLGEADLEVLAKRYVFEPLGLISSTYHPVGDNIAPTEKCPITKKHLKGIVHDDNARFLGVSGNAGLFANLTDVVKFTKMLASRGIHEGKSYMSLRMFEKGIMNYTEGMNESRGLGFSLYTHNMHPSGDLLSYGSFGHTGYTGTSLFIDKNTGLYVVLLTNRVFNGREDTGYLRMRKQIHNKIISYYDNRVYRRK